VLSRTYSFPEQSVERCSLGALNPSRKLIQREGY
jgi:hypothetical protein